MKYSKPPLTTEDQLALLEHRGLIIKNRDITLAWLNHVSYYRLRGYTYPFQQNQYPDHPFNEGTTFEQVSRVYEFDRALRLLVFDAIEQIEVALRTRLVLELSLSHGPWWFENPKLFAHPDRLKKDLGELDKELSRTHEAFIKHYQAKYGDPHRPPAWMSLEIVSFGTLSKIFQNLRIGLEAKKEIARWFGLGRGGAPLLESWFHHLSTIRNLCAHHSRLWNRIARQAPRYGIPCSGDWVPVFPDPQRIYASLSIIGWLVQRITNTPTWRAKLVLLLREYPEISQHSMGFPESWEKTPFWSVQIIDNTKKEHNPCLSKP